ncbi:MAG: hypothetical protein BWY08_02216 [Bacteroidetes bacterium ADurb.Bin174]|jgi:asparagine synthase (glutamine-hydrolysing)|nr:MAG: hypothetical protein BWY08_02216 [Bacteroidetes bacterium ADurb.Bin174]
MHGFIAVISLNKPLPSISFNWKPLFPFQKGYIKRNIQYVNLQIEQFTSKQFLPDKYWIDTDEFIFVTEGLITNIDSLLHTYKADDIPSLISQLYENRENFFKVFTGNFVGFFFHKKQQICIAFNNHTATKRLFYFQHSEHLIFSTDLYTLSKTLSTLHISKSLDIEAAYLLLTSSFMQDDYTLIKEIKQIRAGEYAMCKNEKLKLKFYFHLHEIRETTDSKEKIINAIDELFKEAVRSEFEFEKRRDYTPVTTLSAGLDTRMVALVANDLGYNNQVIFNFSEPGFVEEVVPKQIADDYGLKIEQFGLTADGLLAIEDAVAVNDGLNVYSGSSHTFEAVKTLKIDNIGMIHTGMIGDAVLGSFLSDTIPQSAKITDGVSSKMLLHKAKPIFEKSMANYKNEVIYKFYNRAYCGANNGFLFFNLISESTSPFLYPDFLTYALSIPSKYAYKERIYVDWIMTKHLEYARYIWETIGGKPTNNRLKRFYYRYKRAIIKRLPVQSMWKNSMTPEQRWYDSNPDVKLSLDNYFKQNIDKLSFNKELMEDALYLYNHGNIVEKTQVITLLAACALHFE